MELVPLHRAKEKDEGTAQGEEQGRAGQGEKQGKGGDRGDDSWERELTKSQ